MISLLTRTNIKTYIVSLNRHTVIGSPCFLPIAKSNRFYSKDLTNNRFSIHKDYLQIQLAEETETRLSWLWLRDHCRSDVCYNHNTNQKNTVLEIENTAKVSPASVQILDTPTKRLLITWKDGHESPYDINWLNDLFSPNKKGSRLLWSNDVIKREVLPEVFFKDYLESEEGLKQSLNNLVKYGFTIITEVPASISHTREVAERISCVQETFYGKMWSLTADMTRADTAYTKAGLGAHTDTTYFTCPIGVQVFHCLEHKGDGGETLLVDGFHAAEELRAEHETDFTFLTQAVIAHEYVDQKEGNFYRSFGPVLSLRPGTDDLMNIRFNPFDMAPLVTIPQAKVPTFYSAYKRLSDRITSKHKEFWIKLYPGMVLLVDNWRVLHGRSSFTGSRSVCGCYLGRDDVMNKFRRLQINS